MSVDPVSCSRAEFLEQQLVEMLDLADAALEDHQPAAAVAAKAKAVEWRDALDKLRAYEAEEGVTRTPLEQARAMRRRADATGSFQAARDFFRLELDLLAEAEAQQREADRLRMAGLGLDERIARLAEVLLALPDEVRAQVRSAVFDPVH